jgi:hypothetical protein
VNWVALLPVTTVPVGWLSKVVLKSSAVTVLVGPGVLVAGGVAVGVVVGVEVLVDVGVAVAVLVAVLVGVGVVVGAGVLVAVGVFVAVLVGVLVGAGASGTTALEGAEGSPSPATLSAVTVNVYVCPATSPGTSVLVAVEPVSTTLPSEA